MCGYGTDMGQRHVLFRKDQVITTLKSQELKETEGYLLVTLFMPYVLCLVTAPLWDPGCGGTFWCKWLPGLWGQITNESRGVLPVPLCLRMDEKQSPSVLSPWARTGHLTACQEAGKSGTAKKVIEQHGCPWPRIVVFLFFYLLWFYNFFIKILCQKINVSEFLTFYGWFWGLGILQKV